MGYADIQADIESDTISIKLSKHLTLMILLTALLMHSYHQKNASKLDPFDKSTLAGPDEELGLSVTGIDRFVRLSSFVAIASHINGDRSEKFASNSLIDPSYI